MKQARLVLALMAPFIFGGFPMALAARRLHGLPPSGKAKGAQASQGEDTDLTPSRLRPLIEHYAADRGSLSRSYPISISPARVARLKQFYTEWLDRLAQLDFASLQLDERVDYVLLRNHLDYELQQLEIQAKQFAETEPLMPFAKTIIEMEETRRRMQPVNAVETAALLTRLNRQIEETQKRVEAGLATPAPPNRPTESNGEPIHTKKTVANRAAATVRNLRNALRSWFTFYNGYDPIFTWWVTEPYTAVDRTIGTYASFLSERVAGVKLEESPLAAGAQIGSQRGGLPLVGAAQRQPGAGPGPAPPQRVRPGDSSDIVGDPIGRHALLAELAHEMIPYTPEKLIALAQKEMAWCEAEMVKASRELGYGDDWRKALEHVKTLYVEPGKQPELIRDQALEAVRFLDDHDLVTVPPLARETWRMEMMTPERQLVNPFFTGGEAISVSYPTNTMSYEQKMMSMRGNNIHFSRATVFHELIPGHHLQAFMTARYKPYRSVFSTPFWGEGWALYWELLLWDMHFAKSPENRIGMLFWRMHRCARIIFSLSFHLGQMTPQQCIQFLVERVGHEPENATAEVRRSFEQAAPLYQSAYLLGGLQLYALRKELVDSGKMSNRTFHDAILKENRIPIEMVRAILTRQSLPRDFKSNWKFYGPNLGQD